jgi:hypothetical protein
MRSRRGARSQQFSIRSRSSTRSANDNAHAIVGALYASQVHDGAIHCIGGGFNLPAGNISVTDGQTGLWGGPNASEMKIGAGVKFDGKGAYAVDWAGRMANFNGFQIEGFDNGVGICLRREGGGTSGRANIVSGVRFVSSYRGQIPWIAADDQPRVDVGDEGDVDEARPGPDVGQVGDPQPVRRRRAEVPLDEIPGPFSCVVRHGCEVGLAARDATQAQLAHQPGDGAARDPNAFARFSCAQTRRSYTSIPDGIMTGSSRGLPSS